VIPLLKILKQLFQDGSPKDSFERGMAFKAKCTIFSEGCRGHLGKGLMKHFKLNAGKWWEESKNICILQCCGSGSGSGRIRIILADPDRDRHRHPGHDDPVNLKQKKS
jgi:hypothetical protein